MNRVAVTGVGAVTAAGVGFEAFHSAFSSPSRCSMLTAAGDVRDQLTSKLGISTNDTTRWLLRKKDKKLLSRSAELALGAALEACAGIEFQEDTAIFLGVGREPAETHDLEATLIAAERDGKLDLEQLVNDGLHLVPPLAPLRTLPNLILAHVAIRLQLTGETATFVGDAAAGLQAIVAGFQNIIAGRSQRALVGGADSRVDAASVRDRARLGVSSPPGEGAAMLLLESESSAMGRGMPILGWLVDGGFYAPKSDDLAYLYSVIGDIGPGLGVVHAFLHRDSQQVTVRDSDGASAWVRWEATR